MAALFTKSNSKANTSKSEKLLKELIAEYAIKVAKVFTNIEQIDMIDDNSVVVRTNKNRTYKVTVTEIK